MLPPGAKTGFWLNKFMRWIKVSWQDKTWAEFSTIKMAGRMPWIDFATHPKWLTYT